MTTLNELDERIRRLEALLRRSAEQWDAHWVYPYMAEWVGSQGEPLTSTSWDGDSFSTTAKTLIDLSAVFGVPAGVKAVLVDVFLRDSASAAGTYRLILAPSSGTSGLNFTAAGVTNDTWQGQAKVIPCNLDGDIYYQIVASGSGTMDIFMSIWGYEVRG